MLDAADIVVVNKTDLERAKAALSEIEHRLTQNKRKQQLVATVAKRHRDPGVDELYEMIKGDSVAAAHDDCPKSDGRSKQSRRSKSAATGKKK
jgi:putative protein kinase ArgK-like GTPase of G3E family